MKRKSKQIKVVGKKEAIEVFESSNVENIEDTENEDELEEDSEDSNDEDVELEIIGEDGNYIITKEEAEQRERVKELKEQISSDYWELAYLLRDLHDTKKYRKFGYSTWREYIEEEVDFQVRKSEYLISIINKAEELPEKISEWVKSLGWTKAKEVVKVLNEYNFEEWKNKIDGKSVSEVMIAITENKKEEKLKEIEDGTIDEEKPIKKVFSLYPAQSKNVEEALEKAKSIAETDKDGHALDLICTSYISENIDTDNLQEYLEKVEKIIGHKIMVYDTKQEEIIFGEDIIEQIIDEEGITDEDVS